MRLKTPPPKPILLFALSGSLVMIILSMVFPDVRASIVELTLGGDEPAQVLTQNPLSIVTLTQSAVLATIDTNTLRAADAENNIREESMPAPGPQARATTTRAASLLDTFFQAMPTEQETSAAASATISSSSTPASSISSSAAASTVAITALQESVQRLSSTLESEQDAVAGAIGVPVVQSFTLTINAFTAALTPAQIELLRSDPRVASVEADERVEVVLDRSVGQMSANAAWLKDAAGNTCAESGQQCVTGKNVKIGIIDTGIDYTHTDLGGCAGGLCKVKGGYNLLTATDPWIDDNGHGTHVAAIAAGNGVLKGVAPGASLYAFKAMDKFGAGTSSKIIAAIEKAIDPNGDSDITDRMDVINLSIGCTTCHNPDDAMSRAADLASAAGVIVVAASGNNGPEDGTVNSPGVARSVITVGAVDRDGIPSNYTAHGPTLAFTMKPDILAPGSSICSAKKVGTTLGTDCLDSNHMALSGTSMAAPHITGLSALIRQAHPDWTPAQVKFAMRSTAKGMTNFDARTVVANGYGLVDSLKAVISNYTYEPINLQTAGGFDGKIDIKGTIGMPNIASYKLTALSLSSTDSIVLTNINHAPTSDTLLQQYDTIRLKAGEKYILTLEVTDTAGRVQRDATLFYSTRALPLAGTDIAITRSGPANIARGGSGTFIVQVQNRGTSNAPSVTVSDYYPTNNAFTLIASKSTPGCKQTGISAVRCDIGALAPGASTTLTLVYAVALPAACTSQTLQSYAYAASTVPDPDTSNNRTPVLGTNVTCPLADVSIATAGPTATMVGEPMSYMFIIGNAGPSIAKNVRMTTTLPAGLVLGSSNDSSCKKNAAGTLTCSAATLAPGITKTILVTAHIASGTACPGTAPTQASVTSSVNDPQPGNNASTPIATTFTCRPDVSLTQSGPSSVTQGSTLTDTVILTNNGTLTSAAMSIKMAVPTGTTFKAAPLSSSGCTAAGGTVTCKVSPLAAGGTAQYAIAFQANTACNTTITTSASVKQNAPDANPANDKALPDITTTVLCP
ncbi:MAG: S8 family serine peptidase [Candidatus Peribacteraceae bacterium]|nr:S8 family serine peptidase [Candidatus Peribacteraceae bacterium]